MRIILNKTILFAIVLLSACSDTELVTEKSELIYRDDGEELYPISLPEHRVRASYPWEDRMIGNLPKITKEYFRCKGSSHNPLKFQEKMTYTDCSGIDGHSLPVDGEKEMVYPILIDLLNYLQAKLGKKVIITCGHRCPVHNNYADHSRENQKSKHLVGAEVDFYIQGLEDEPEKAVELLMDYYREDEATKGKSAYEIFSRYDRESRQTRIPPWYNKEILIKLYQKDEGRDFDNRHPYPYIGIELRYDRQRSRNVYYTWHKAFNGYMRW